MNPNPRSIKAAAALMLLLLVAACVSDFLSPVPAEQQDLTRFYAPPTRIHFIEPGMGFHWRPFIYDSKLLDPLNVSYQEDRAKIFLLEFFPKGFRYRFLGLIPASVHLLSAQGFHPWGTDELGRDVLARALSGARTSLLIVFIGVLLYAFLGLALGSLAGSLGGWVDSMLMRFSEFVLALPVLYLILALRAMLPLKMPFWPTLLLTAGTIAGVTWPPMARGVRGVILQLRNSGYVEAARATGCSRLSIFFHHMIPALPPFVLAQAVVAAPVFLLGEVVLSFLDVGFRDSGESWGLMLRGLRSDPRIMTDFWWNLAPLILIFVTMFCLNVLSRRAHPSERRSLI